MSTTKEEIVLRSPSREELTWINAKYAEVEFVASEFDTEDIVIAEINGERAGIGRVIRINDSVKEIGGIYVFEGFRGRGAARKIVEHLCSFLEPNSDSYVIPYAELKEFYESFGFKEVTRTATVPKEIHQKWEFCKQAYDKKVLLMKL